MTNQFINKRLFNNQRIKILEDRLEVFESSFFKTLQYDILLEEIEHHKTIKTGVNGVLLAYSVIIFIIGGLGGGLGYSIFFNISLGVSILLIVLGLIIKINIITLNFFGDKLEIRFNTNERDDAVNFADSIIASSKNFIINKYSRIDKDLPKEKQLDNLDYLLKENLIDKARFCELKNNLLGNPTNATKD